MTKVLISNDETIEVSSQMVECVKGKFVAYEFNNVFNVTIDYENKKEVFEYTISIQDTKNGKKELSHEDHISAVYSFIGDAIAGEMSFETFMDEFGYTDCRCGYKIHKACIKSMEQFSNLNMGDAYDISNFIQEHYPNEV